MVVGVSSAESERRGSTRDYLTIQFQYLNSTRLGLIGLDRIRETRRRFK